MDLFSIFSKRSKHSGTQAVKPSGWKYQVGADVEFITGNHTIIKGTVFQQVRGIWSAAYWVKDKKNKAHFIHETEIRLPQRLAKIKKPAKGQS